MRVFHNSLNVAGTALRVTVKTTPTLHVGRGPVPRRASVEETAVACGFRADRAVAGDRPPRYGPRRGSRYRRARDRPSPASARLQELKTNRNRLLMENLWNDLLKVQ